MMASPFTVGYCWPTYIKVLGVLCLREVSSTFLPSKKACWAHQFQYLGVGQQYPGVICAPKYEADYVPPTSVVLPRAKHTQPVPAYSRISDAVRKPSPFDSVCHHPGDVQHGVLDSGSA